MTLARRTIGSAPDPHAPAFAPDDGGWDPYDVWYTRVLLPRRRAELAAANLRPIATACLASDATTEALLIAAVPPTRA
jgi:hypothetical protein